MGRPRKYDSDDPKQRERMRYRAYWKKNKEKVRQKNRERYRKKRASMTTEQLAQRNTKRRRRRRENLERARELGRKDSRLHIVRYGRPKREPEKEQARTWVKREIKSGRLKKPEICPRCGRTDSRIEAHHDDYSKPAQIEWLCSLCHGEHRATTC